MLRSLYSICEDENKKAVIIFIIEAGRMLLSHQVLQRLLQDLHAELDML